MLCIPLYFSEEIFIAIGVGPVQAKFAGQFCRSSYYFVIAASVNFLEAYFMSSIKLNTIQTYIMIIVTLLHPFSLWIFVIECDFRLTGVALAQSINYTIQLLLLALYKRNLLRNNHPIRNMMAWPTLAELKLNDLYELSVLMFHCFV